RSCHPYKHDETLAITVSFVEPATGSLADRSTSTTPLSAGWRKGVHDERSPRDCFFTCRSHQTHVDGLDRGDLACSIRRRVTSRISMARGILRATMALLAEELMLRENRRIKTALVMARLSTIKTLASFDFAFATIGVLLDPVVGRLEVANRNGKKE